MRTLKLIAFLCLGMVAYGQEIYVETGRNTSSFQFADSNGVELQNLQSTSSGGIDFGYKHQILTKGLDVGLGMSFNSYGSIGSDNALGNFFKWEADYVGLKLGLEYDVVTVNKLSLFVNASFSGEFLTRGVQTLNNQVFDIKGVEEFDNTAFFYRGGFGLTYPMSSSSKVYAQYQFGKSLPLKNDAGSGNSELVIESNIISIGISVGLFSNESKEDENIEKTESNN